MPTYQYACTECGERLEAVQKFTDDPLTVCSVCGGKLRKLFSPVGIVFKGSGFYRTDSRSGANGSAAREKKADSPAGSGSESGGPESGGSGSGGSESGGSGSKAGSGPSGGDGKPGKKTETAGSTPSGAKVA